MNLELDLASAIAKTVDEHREQGADPTLGELSRDILRAARYVVRTLGVEPCPVCLEDIGGFIGEPQWFKATGGHPGDSGAGGNTPQDPVAEGVQTCPHCGATWAASY